MSLKLQVGGVRVASSPGSWFGPMPPLLANLPRPMTSMPGPTVEASAGSAG
jgi:hypothetical protein